MEHGQEFRVPDGSTEGGPEKPDLKNQTARHSIQLEQGETMAVGKELPKAGLTTVGFPQPNLE